MVEISPEEFMRALAYARGVKAARPKEDVYTLLVGRLGEMIFRHEARRALPAKEVGDLNWIALPKHLNGTGVDLRIRGWKLAVKTPSVSMMLVWPDCKKADLFPKVQLDKSCLRELAARYRNPKRSTPIGLLDDPILRVIGEVTGWIGIGTAEQIFGENTVMSRVDDQLASAASLWALLKAGAGPNIKRADDVWRHDREDLPVKKTRTRPSGPSTVVLLPPRRRAQAAPAV